MYFIANLLGFNQLTLHDKFDDLATQLQTVDIEDKTYNCYNIEDSNPGLNSVAMANVIDPMEA